MNFDIHLKHLVYFAALLSLEVKAIRDNFVRTNSIIVNFAFSGVLQDTGGRHV